jgi:hypothetical protein
MRVTWSSVPMDTLTACPNSGATTRGQPTSNVFSTWTQMGKEKQEIDRAKAVRSNELWEAASRQSAKIRTTPSTFQLSWFERRSLDAIALSQAPPPTAAPDKLETPDGPLTNTDTNTRPPHPVAYRHPRRIATLPPPRPLYKSDSMIQAAQAVQSVQTAQAVDPTSAKAALAMAQGMAKAAQVMAKAARAAQETVQKARATAEATTDDSPCRHSSH